MLSLLANSAALEPNYLHFSLRGTSTQTQEWTDRSLAKMFSLQTADINMPRSITDSQ